MLNLAFGTFLSVYAYTFGGIKFSLEPSNVVMLFAVCKMGHAWHNGKNTFFFTSV